MLRVYVLVSAGGDNWQQFHVNSGHRSKRGDQHCFIGSIGILLAHLCQSYLFFIFFCPFLSVSLFLFHVLHPLLTYANLKVAQSLRHGHADLEEHAVMYNVWMSHETIILHKYVFHNTAKMITQQFNCVHFLIMPRVKPFLCYSLEL